MISGILLAAGDSKRMGEPKALLPYDGITFIDSILNKFSGIGCKPIITILGAAAELICQKTQVNTFQCFNNPNHEDVQVVIKEAIEKLKAMGKPGGTLAFNPVDAKRYFDWGFQFVAVGSDINLLVNGSDDLLAKFK